MLASSKNLLRSRTAPDHGRVTFIELFFDLVFVFAVTQLSHRLISHFTPLGAVETLLLMLAVWWVWIFTSWATNWLDPERLPVRLALIAIMLIGLLMSASIPKAFESRGLVFGATYASIQVGRTLFVIWATARHDRVLTRNFYRILAWLATSAIFWIAGGLADEHHRLALWAIAIGLEFVAPTLGFWTPGLGKSRASEWQVEGHHLSERCALFVIIALGESLLVTGATFSTLQWTSATVTAMIASFAGSVAMWWLYFDASAKAGSQHISGSETPGQIARLAYTYIHLPIIAGIIVAAAGDEFVLAHPAGQADLKTAVTVIGSVALYLTGSTLFKWVISGHLPISPLIGLAVLGILLLVSPTVTPVALSVSATLVIIAIAAWEARTRRHDRQHQDVI